MVRDVQCESGRLCCPDEPARRTVSLDGGDGDETEGAVLERTQLQTHALGDDSLGHQALKTQIFSSLVC